MEHLSAGWPVVECPDPCGKILLRVQPGAYGEAEAMCRICRRRYVVDLARAKVLRPAKRPLDNVAKV